MKKILLLLPFLLLASCENSSGVDKVKNYFQNNGDRYYNDSGYAVYSFSYGKDVGSDYSQFTMYYSEMKNIFRMVSEFGALNNYDVGYSQCDFTWRNFNNGDFSFYYLVQNVEVLVLDFNGLNFTNGKVNSGYTYNVVVNKGISNSTLNSTVKSAISLIESGISFFDYWINENGLPNYR